MGDVARLTEHVERVAALARQRQPVAPVTAAPHALDCDLDEDCSCGWDAMASEVEQGREQARQMRWAGLVPSRFAWATVADLDERVAAVVTEWAARPAGRNLLLFGPVGTGKTHAAVAAARVCYFDRRFDVTFAPVVELLDQLRPGGPDGALEDLCHVDVLVVDDLGSERATDWTAERLFAVVNRRWLEERPTVFTTNLTGKELEAAVGARTYSRVVGGAVAVKVEGVDRRLGR